MNAEQCVYMQAAYPTLDGDDTCEGFHRHEPRVYDLARALTATFQDEPITDEKVAWFLNDADAVVDDFDPTPDAWTVTEGERTASDYGIDQVLWINGIEYVLPASEFEPSTPVTRATWESWHDDYEEDE